MISAKLPQIMNRVLLRLIKKKEEYYCWCIVQSPYFDRQFHYRYKSNIETISNENKTCYLMGDFNIDLLKEEVYRPIRDYLNLLFSHSFLPKLVKPTRITPTTATLIDNILTNNHDDVNSLRSQI